MFRKLFTFILLFSYQIVFSDTLIIQSTTSTRDSGLYKYLLPFYPDFHNVKIKVIAVGTGQAIMNARNCDGNILIVHDQKREKMFMDNGFGLKRHELMYNDFILVGPKIDKAEVSTSESIDEAFSKIYKYQHKFISRSDSSGTHSAEMDIWKNVSLKPGIHSGDWYLETGQGMGQSLNIAISLDGYIFTDRSSWLRFNNKSNHTILYENPTELKNSYGMILINHNRCNNLEFAPAEKLFNWLSSDDAASLIKSYKIMNSNVFYIE